MHLVYNTHQLWQSYILYHYQDNKSTQKYAHTQTQTQTHTTTTNLQLTHVCTHNHRHKGFCKTLLQAGFIQDFVCFLTQNSKPFPKLQQLKTMFPDQVNAQLHTEFEHLQILYSPVWTLLTRSWGGLKFNISSQINFVFNCYHNQYHLLVGLLFLYFQIPLLQTIWWLLVLSQTSQSFKNLVH